MTTYRELNTDKVKLLLKTYFGRLESDLPLVTSLPLVGLQFHTHV